MKISFLVCLIGVLIVSPTFSTNLNYQSKLYDNLRRNLQYESDNIARQGNTDDLYSDYKKYFPFYSMNVAREGKPLSLYQDLRTSLDNEDAYNHSAVNYRNNGPEDEVYHNYPSNAKLPDNVDMPQKYDQLNPPGSYYHNAMEPSNINMDEYNNPQVQTEDRFGYPYGGYGGGGGYGYGYGGAGAHAGAGAYGGARGNAKLSAGISGGFSAGLSAGIDAGAEAGAGAGAYGYGGGGGGGYGYGYGR